MTEEDQMRFALVLKGCERICAMIAQEEAALASDATGGGIPIVAAVAEERMAVPVMISAA